MNKFFLLSGSVLGLLGVAIGAFGAHALKGMLEAAGRADTFETGVRYLFYHAIALVLGWDFEQRISWEYYLLEWKCFHFGFIDFFRKFVFNLFHRN
jgi:uncharacterized membrane protein YgdD (TMEM256/DUF423 family)